MITFTKAYQSSDGQTWPTLELAQDRELRQLLQLGGSELSKSILANKDQIVEILTSKGSQRARKPRRDKGTKRKPKLVAGEVI